MEMKTHKQNAKMAFIRSGSQGAGDRRGEAAECKELKECTEVLCLLKDFGKPESQHEKTWPWAQQSQGTGLDKKA